MSKKLSNLYAFLCVGAALLLILFSDTALSSVTLSAQRCVHSILPSFFPMMVLSRQIYSGLSLKESKFFDTMIKMSGFSRNTFPVFLSGLFCGYPAPAAICKSAMENSRLTKEEAELTALLCNNASPAFVILLAGNGVYGSIYIGIVLYIVQTFSVICAAHIFDISKNDTIFSPESRAESLAGSVIESVRSILCVFGFVIFFSLASDGVQKLMLYANAPYYLRILASGMIETTGSISSLYSLPENIKAAFICAFCATGGLSVYFQISALVKISFIKYLKVRGTVFLLMSTSFFTVLKIFDILSLL